jgi:hypothetical protein
MIGKGIGRRKFGKSSVVQYRHVGGEYAVMVTQKVQSNLAIRICFGRNSIRIRKTFFWIEASLYQERMIARE